MILLVHRQSRDDEACKAKYGDDWDTVRPLPSNSIRRSVTDPRPLAFCVAHLSTASSSPGRSFLTSYVAASSVWRKAGWLTVVHSLSSPVLSLTRRSREPGWPAAANPFARSHGPACALFAVWVRRAHCKRGRRAGVQPDTRGSKGKKDGHEEKGEARRARTTASRNNEEGRETGMQAWGMRGGKKAVIQHGGGAMRGGGRREEQGAME